MNPFKHPLIVQHPWWSWRGHLEWLLAFHREAKGRIAIGNQAVAPPLGLAGRRFDHGNALIFPAEQPQRPERTPHAHQQHPHAVRIRDPAAFPLKLATFRDFERAFTPPATGVFKKVGGIRVQIRHHIPDHRSKSRTHPFPNADLAPPLSLLPESHVRQVAPGIGACIHPLEWHPALGGVFDLGGIAGAEDIIPAQAIQTRQKRRTRVDPIGQHRYGHPVRNEIIDRVEQCARCFGPGRIRGVDEHAQRHAHAIGGPTNLDDGVLGAVAGFVHRQIQVSGRHAGLDGANKRIGQLVPGEAQIAQDAADVGGIAARVGAKGGAVSDRLDEQRAGFKDARHQLDKPPQDGGCVVGEVLA